MTDWQPDRRDARTGTDCSAVTRFEVIDHSGGAVTCMPGMPRLVAAYGVSVELSLQDDGRTLKVFLRGQAAAALPQEGRRHQEGERREDPCGCQRVWCRGRWHPSGLVCGRHWPDDPEAAAIMREAQDE